MGAKHALEGSPVPSELAEELMQVEELLLRLEEKETPGAKKRSTA